MHIDPAKPTENVAAAEAKMSAEILKFNAFWFGSDLDPITSACLYSFVEMGHPVTLHVYDLPKGVPAGVSLSDAACILPRETVVIQKRTGSLALFSDRFRYELLALDRGAWIDCDMLCLRPIEAAQYIFGWEDYPDLINGAILMLPPASAILADLRAIFSTPRWVPPWETLWSQLGHKVRYWCLPGYGIPDMRHIVAGPSALTYYCRKHHLVHRAASRETYYPVGWSEIGVFLEEAVNVSRFLTRDSVCIHLWNTLLTPAFREANTGKASFLSRVIDGTWRESIRG